MKLKLHCTGIALLVLSFWVTSCRSSERMEEKNNAQINNVKIRISMPNEAYKQGEVPIEKTQKRKIDLEDGSFAIATLTPIYGSINKVNDNMPKAETKVEQSQLKPGVKYKVVAYDSNGKYVTEKIFTSGQKEEGFRLDGGKEYTFVAYSINTTDNVPSISNPENLSSAKLDNISGDLMYFKRKMIVSGDRVNYLDVILKHQFSEITTTLDARQVGTFKAINLPSIKPSSKSANISFADNVITYNETNPDGAA
ncbi:hypothetical protein GNY06_02250, partial [Elizabethkingia argentiflava]|nr:hypothetical protein [Elizabethkingia argenteiflava]